MRGSMPRGFWESAASPTKEHLGSAENRFTPHASTHNATKYHQHSWLFCSYFTDCQALVTCTTVTQSHRLDFAVTSSSLTEGLSRFTL